MKSVLKRRKHRKGIRPVRKGTLKVRMIELPSKEEHSQAVTSLMARREKFASLDEALMHLKNGNKIEFDKAIALSKGYTVIIGLMQKGYDYFRHYRQTEPVTLALKVIIDEGPVLQEPIKPTNACASCYLKNNCPFNAVPKDLREFACPTIARAYLNDLKRALNEKELTVTEMAELALTHLS